MKCVNLIATIQFARICAEFTALIAKALTLCEEATFEISTIAVKTTFESTH